MSMSTRQPLLVSQGDEGRKAGLAQECCFHTETQSKRLLYKLSCALDCPTSVSFFEGDNAFYVHRQSEREERSCWIRPKVTWIKLDDKTSSPWQWLV